MSLLSFLMPLTNRPGADRRAFGVALFGGVMVFLMIVLLVSGGLILKSNRKAHGKVIVANSCYVWHDGRVQCDSNLCPPHWQCNGNASTNNPRCCKGDTQYAP